MRVLFSLIVFLTTSIASVAFAEDQPPSIASIIGLEYSPIRVDRVDEALSLAARLVGDGTTKIHRDFCRGSDDMMCFYSLSDSHVLIATAETKTGEINRLLVSQASSYEWPKDPQLPSDAEWNRVRYLVISATMPKLPESGKWSILKRLQDPKVIWETLGQEDLNWKYRQYTKDGVTWFIAQTITLDEQALE